MSEIEDLQRNTIEALKDQRMKELMAYLTVLGNDVDEAFRKEKWGSFVWGGSLAIWIVFTFLDYFFKTGDMFYEIGLFVYLIGYAFNVLCREERVRAMSAYKSALKVLEILGIIDPPTPHAPKNKKKVFEEGITLVKKWVVQKKKMQEEAYQPA